MDFDLDSSTICAGEKLQRLRETEEQSLPR